MGLGAAISEALAEKDLVSLQDFLRARESIYHRPPWSSSLSPWSVAAWVFRQLGAADVLAGAGSSSSSEKIPRGRFVVLANLEAAAKVFAGEASQYSTRFERTFSKVHFYKTFADRLMATGHGVGALSETDMDALLTFLSRDKDLILYDGATVKIKTASTASTASAAGEEASVLTEEDASIAQLKELLAHLDHQTAALARRVEELGRSAKAAVAGKNRAVALAALRSKKLAEASLEKRLATAGQLEEVASRIEQASDNVRLVEVMESSGEALRSLNAAVGGAARVEDVVGRLREQTGEADEVTSILAEGGSAGAVLDEAEIDEELAEMEGQERRKEEEEKERAKKQEVAEQQEREADETRKRLEAIEGPKVPTPDAGTKLQQEGSSGDERLVEGAAEELSRMSLKE